MRLKRFLNEEDSIKKALAMEEPEVGEEYSEEEVASKLEVLQIAIGKQAESLGKLKKGNGSEDQLKAARGIMADLEDKEEKWDNWEKEVKSQGPSPEPAAGEEEPLPPEGEEEEEEEEEEEK